MTPPAAIPRRSDQANARRKLLELGMIAALGVVLGCSSGGGWRDDAGFDGGGAGGGTQCDSPRRTPSNLVPNPGFECGDVGWSPQSGTLEALEDGGAHSG